MSTSSNGGVPVTTPGNPAPGHFALSAPFAALLAEFTFENDHDEDTLMVVHEPCLGSVRAVRADASMDTLLQSVISHDCT